MIKKISLCAVFSSLAIVISTLESFIPLQLIIPLPGVKLGLSNCVILYLLVKYGFKYTFPVMVFKTSIVSLLFTGLTSFLYSFAGGLLSILVMWFLLKFKKFFSIYGVSISGAAFHNIGQIVAASIMLNSIYIFNYLPFLLFVSLFTGYLCGIISDVLIKRIKLNEG